MLRKQEDFDEERFWNQGGRASSKGAPVAKPGVGCA